MSWFRWAIRILAPLLLAELFLRRFNYICYKTPKVKGRMSAVVAEMLVRPGDVLLCKGDSIDSASVCGWSCSLWSHVAVIGPDLMVYDMTPIVDERRMSLAEYVREYQGVVFLRRIRREESDKIRWQEVGKRKFSDHPVTLLGATLSENPLVGLWSGVFKKYYSQEKAFCSEYVCLAMGLEGAHMSHPKSFAPRGKYDRMYEPGYENMIQLVE